MKRWLYACMLAAMTAAGQSAVAGSPAELTVSGAAPNGSGGTVVRELRLSYDPDSLSAPDAAKALYARISQAAERVCALPRGARADAKSDRMAETCRASAVSAALGRVGMPAPAKAGTPPAK